MNKLLTLIAITLILPACEGDRVKPQEVKKDSLGVLDLDMYEFFNSDQPLAMRAK